MKIVLSLALLSLLMPVVAGATLPDDKDPTLRWFTAIAPGYNFDSNRLRLSARLGHHVNESFSHGFFFTSDRASGREPVSSFGLRSSMRVMLQLYVGADLGFAVGSPGSPRSGHGIIEPHLGYQIGPNVGSSIAPELVLRLHGDKSVQVVAQVALALHR